MCGKISSIYENLLSSIQKREKTLTRINVSIQYKTIYHPKIEMKKLRDKISKSEQFSPLLNHRIAYDKCTRKARGVPCSESADWRGRCTRCKYICNVLHTSRLTISLSLFLFLSLSFSLVTLSSSVHQPRFYLSPVSATLLIRLIAPPCSS